MNRLVGWTFLVVFLLIGALDVKTAKSYRANCAPGSGMSWSGVISRPEVNAFMYGTHLLHGHVASDAGTKAQLFALRSNAVNLDTWIGRAVIVNGVLVEGYPLGLGPPLIEVRSVTVSSANSFRR